MPLSKGIGVSTSVYRLPAVAARARGVLSNTAPTSAYRAAGRPEVMFVIERLIDLAARRHGFDRLALRKRNLVPAAAMPYRNPFGLVYDSGDYAAAQERAAAAADWAGFEARRAEALKRGRYRGIGLANYIELNTGAPREQAEITVRPEGGSTSCSARSRPDRDTRRASPSSSPTGSRSTLRRCGSSPATATWRKSAAARHSGRSMRMGAVVMRRASDKAIDEGRKSPPICSRPPRRTSSSSPVASP